MTFPRQVELTWAGVHSGTEVGSKSCFVFVSMDWHSVLVSWKLVLWGIWGYHQPLIVMCGHSCYHMESSRTLIFVQNGHLGCFYLLASRQQRPWTTLDANVLFKSFYTLCPCEFQWCALSAGSPVWVPFRVLLIMPVAIRVTQDRWLNGLVTEFLCV